IEGIDAPPFGLLRVPDAPSSSPQSSPPQPKRDPFNPSSLRSAKINDVVPSTRTSIGVPFTVSVTPIVAFLPRGGAQVSLTSMEVVERQFAKVRNLLGSLRCSHAQFLDPRLSAQSCD